MDEVFGRYWETKGQYHAGANNLKFHLKNFMLAFGATRPITDLKPIDISSYISYRRADGAAPGTINRALDDLRAVIYAAQNEWGWEMPDLQISKFKLKVPAENVKYFTREEVEKLLAAAAPHLQLIIKIALYTGFRRRNVLNLKWSEINFEARTITVKVKDGKKEGGKHHTIPISDDFMRLLYALPRTSEYVIGCAIKDVKTSFRRAQYRAGIPYRSFHTLRHTCATWLLVGGANLRTVQKILGHSDITVTEKYAHVLDEQKREAVDTIKI